MKTSCLRLAAFAAGLLVASAAAVNATIVTTWNNWTSGVGNQYGWTSLGELYANDPLTGNPAAAKGVLLADGGGIYTSFYYSFNDYVTFQLTPGSFEPVVSGVTLEIKRTYNPDTNGPLNLVLHYKSSGVWDEAVTPVPTVDGVNEDDFTYDWDFSELNVTEFYITWEYDTHSTFNEIILTQN